MTSMLAAAQKLINMILRAAYAEGGAVLPILGYWTESDIEKI